jgi:two-component system chemotaxis response regulator CheY
MIKNVVIADDSALARMFIRRCLEIAGLGDANFIEASDGSEAISCMKKIKADLLVTDLTMPNMNGIELMRKISSSPRLSGTPVLVVTSAGNEEQRRELTELGVTRILSKPISPPILIEAIQLVNRVLSGKTGEEDEAAEAGEDV